MLAIEASHALSSRRYADPLSYPHAAGPVIAQLSPRDRLWVFLVMVRSVAHSSSFSGNLVDLVAGTAGLERSDEPLVVLGEHWLAGFRSRVAPVTREQFAQLVGPIMFAALAERRTVSDEFLEGLVARGVRMLHL